MTLQVPDSLKRLLTQEFQEKSKSKSSRDLIVLVEVKNGPGHVSLAFVPRREWIATQTEFLTSLGMTADRMPAGLAEIRPLTERRPGTFGVFLFDRKTAEVLAFHLPIEKASIFS